MSGNEIPLALSPVRLLPQQAIVHSVDLCEDEGQGVPAAHGTIAGGHCAAPREL